MTADLENLLKPIEGEIPAGPDLSYDDKRIEIEQAFEAVASSDSNGSDATDWRYIIGLILDQAERTLDLWLPVYLARAGARSNRLETVELGCEYLAGLFENHWDTVHPALDEYGYVGRKGPCESLARIGEFIGPLRRMTLVAHPRLGSFSGEDVERFAREGEAAENYGLFRAAIAELPQEEIQTTLERLGKIRAAIGRADAVLSQHADGDTSTNFDATYAALDSIRSALAPYCTQNSGPTADSPATDSAVADLAVPAGKRGPSGSIDTRDDVIRALDAVIDYYRRREPGSPVPVAVQRAKTWVNLDFLAVLADIAPESIGEARRVLSSPSSEELN